MTNASQKVSDKIEQNKTKVSDKSYETAVNELENILHQLETNDLPLEKAIQEFEQGVGLVKHCQSILAQTEEKIQGLMPNEKA